MPAVYPAHSFGRVADSAGSIREFAACPAPERSGPPAMRAFGDQAARRCAAPSGPGSSEPVVASAY